MGKTTRSLIAVAKASKTMLNSSGGSGHPCLIPDFRGNAFNFSPWRIMFAVQQLRELGRIEKVYYVRTKDLPDRIAHKTHH